jgi:hypothetical protein
MAYNSFMKKLSSTTCFCETQSERSDEVYRGKNLDLHPQTMNDRGPSMSQTAPDEVLQVMSKDDLKIETHVVESIHDSRCVELRPGLKRVRSYTFLNKLHSISYF